MLNPFLLLLVYTFCPVSSRWKMHQIFPIRFGTPGNTHEKLWNADSFYSEKSFLEPVFTRNMCWFSSIILLQTRQKYAGGLSPGKCFSCSMQQNLPKRHLYTLVKTGSYRKRHQIRRFRIWCLFLRKFKVVIKLDGKVSWISWLLFPNQTAVGKIYGLYLIGINRL